MIAHVAEAGEERGRVVLRYDVGSLPSTMSIAAAVRVAQAFQSGIESLVIADRQLYELVAFPFAAEVSRAGRTTRLSIEALERDIVTAAGGLNRVVGKLAAQAGVNVRKRLVRDEPLLAVARTCAELGPWNVVALAEPLAAGHPPALRALFDMVHGATGIVVAGPKGRNRAGPVLVAIEDLDRLPPMLRAAERIADVTRDEVKLLLIGEDPRELDWMEDQARLVLGEMGRVSLEPSVPARSSAEIAERLRRLCGGFLIAQFGGVVVPGSSERTGDLGPLLAALECPMLLVR
ncbi:MAG: hypothetical protein CTY20_06365 [Hyphomicrobium sp.]|nr:MAG: hypothetical protein CTY20_06365 [Hyphomicrobium sp.]